MPVPRTQTHMWLSLLSHCRHARPAASSQATADNSGPAQQQVQPGSHPQQRDQLRPAAGTETVQHRRCQHYLQHRQVLIAHTQQQGQGSNQDPCTLSNSAAGTGGGTCPQHHKQPQAQQQQQQPSTPQPQQTGHPAAGRQLPEASHSPWLSCINICTCSQQPSTVDKQQQARHTTACAILCRAAAEGCSMSGATCSCCWHNKPMQFGVWASTTIGNSGRSVCCCCSSGKCWRCPARTAPLCRRAASRAMPVTRAAGSASSSR